MTNDQRADDRPPEEAHPDGPAPSRDDDRSPEEAQADEAPSSQRDASALDPAAQEAARRIGGALGRFARHAKRSADIALREAEARRPATERAARDAARGASERARAAFEAARPEVERITRRAQVTAKVVAPKVGQAARGAGTYVRAHDDQLRRAAVTSARIAARTATPITFRPVVDAFDTELNRPAPPKDPHPNPAQPEPVEGPQGERGPENSDSSPASGGG